MTEMKKARWVEVASGTLERNADKERDNQPDFKGKLNLSVTEELLKEIAGAKDGVKVYISGWQKEGDHEGKPYKFVSLSVSYPFEGDGSDGKEVTKVDADMAF